MILSPSSPHQAQHTARQQLRLPRRAAPHRALSRSAQAPLLRLAKQGRVVAVQDRPNRTPSRVGRACRGKSHRAWSESRSTRRRQEALHRTRADVALQRPRRRFEQPRAKLRAEAWRAPCRRLQPSNDRPVQTLIRPRAETIMPSEGHSCAPDSRPARLLNRGVEWVMLDHSQRRRQFVVHARPFRHSGNLDRQSRPIIRHLLG